MRLHTLTFPRAAIAVAAFASLAIVPTTYAQDYPSRPIRVIVPFSPGGAVDGPMRMVAQELGKRLNQQVIVENKPGAGATLGTEIVAKSPPDGYTLLLASQTNAISASLYRSLSYDPIEDFAPISLIGREPGVIVVHPSLPVKTLAELIAYAKERPGKTDYASSGNGSGQHLFMALLLTSTGTQMNHIPYKGSGQATADLLGGQVMVSIPGTAGMVGHIKAGKLRPLAVTGATRSPQLPDVPTVMESGVPGYEAYVWLGLLAPKGTPQPIIDKLHGEVVEILKMPAVQEALARVYMEPVASTPKEMADAVAADLDRWQPLIEKYRISLD